MAFGSAWRPSAGAACCRAAAPRAASACRPEPAVSCRARAPQAAGGVPPGRRTRAEMGDARPDPSGRARPTTPRTAPGSASPPAARSASRSCATGRGGGSGPRLRRRCPFTRRPDRLRIDRPRRDGAAAVCRSGRRSRNRAEAPRPVARTERPMISLMSVPCCAARSALYQLGLAPVLGPNCRYRPTCSDYAQEAIRLHGAVARQRLWRGADCALPSLGRRGYDPVPPGAFALGRRHGTATQPDHRDRAVDRDPDRLRIFRGAHGQAAAFIPRRRPRRRRQPAPGGRFAAPCPPTSRRRPPRARADMLGKSPRVKIATPRLDGSIDLVGARLDDLTLVNYRETPAPQFAAGRAAGARRHRPIPISPNSAGSRRRNPAVLTPDATRSGRPPADARRRSSGDADLGQRRRACASCARSRSTPTTCSP